MRRPAWEYCIPQILVQFCSHPSAKWRVCLADFAPRLRPLGNTPATHSSKDDRILVHWNSADEVQNLFISGKMVWSSLPEDDPIKPRTDSCQMYRTHCITVIIYPGIREFHWESFAKRPCFRERACLMLVEWWMAFREQ